MYQCPPAEERIWIKTVERDLRVFVHLIIVRPKCP